ncbi:carbohydrate kinase family protein [Sulfitobacter sediminilitoris]|nr:carbohydrate kinase [Sulfitobacter sediminilitoris]
MGSNRPSAPIWSSEDAAVSITQTDLVFRMILCCGEALVDMIPVDLPAGGKAYAPHAGGAVFNTAIALGRLGVETGMVSGVSTDTFGRMLASQLEENGVSTAYLARSGRLTTLALVHIENGGATYSFYDENSAGRSLTFADMPALGDEVSALYFGGISLVAEPAADAYASLLAKERANRVVMIDPNIRPGFISAEHTYRDRLDRMIGQSDIIKVSDEDLDWLIEGEETIEIKAAAMRGRGPAIVVVTKGAEGATAFFGDASVGVAAPVTHVVDTVGAGDTFNAGFLAGLNDKGCLSKDALGSVSDDVIHHALSLGATVAAVTVSRAGANPPWASEINR